MRPTPALMERCRALDYHHMVAKILSTNTASIEYIQYAGIIGGVLGLVAIGLFHRVFDKRMTLIIGVTVYTCTQTIPVGLQLMELMPTDPIVLRWILVSLQR